MKDYLQSRYASIKCRTWPSAVRRWTNTSRGRGSSPAWSDKWTHPKTGETYSIHLSRSPELSSDEFDACFDILEETSSADYRASAAGWHPLGKKEEMRTHDLRYILVKDEGGDVRAFTSLMPCFEEGEPVVYCYEIHLKSELRG